MAYVDRDKVRDMLHREIEAWGSSAEEIDALLKANDELFKLPEADVAPVVHGRWVLIETGYGAKIYECSECKDDDYWKHHFAWGGEHYCPNCGARMDGGE